MLKGKKTYLAALAVALVAALDWYGAGEVPEEVYALLGAAGLMALRAGVSSESAGPKGEAHAAALYDLLEDVLRGLETKAQPGNDVAPLLPRRPRRL